MTLSRGCMARSTYFTDGATVYPNLAPIPGVAPTTLSNPRAGHSRPANPETSAPAGETSRLSRWQRTSAFQLLPARLETQAATVVPVPELPRRQWLPQSPQY